jgi:poly(hydroxyalkanoate) depolymerase family esterase
MTPSLPVHFLCDIASRFRHALRVRGLPVLLAVLCSFLPISVQASWNNAAETLEGHPTWIYTPSTAMSNGKHGLLIVLHGCLQTNTELKDFGNLATTSDRNAVVVAVPYVAAKIWQLIPSTKCWDYDGAQDKQGDIADIVKIAEELKARSGLNIDPDHVYVAGLSSGAALALDIACRAPDVFAGVGAVAGPSPGSSQIQATQFVPPDNAATALQTCRNLAGNNASAFATQIANITIGNMDKGAPNDRYPYQQGADNSSHAGQISVVPIQWSADNVTYLKQLYGTGDLNANETVPGGLGVQQIARKDGKQRISYLVVNNVGHAWPAGTGLPNVPPPDGIFIAQSGLNYPDYLVSWLIANNLRAQPTVGPVVTVLASAQGKDVTATGIATNRDGSTPSVSTALLNGVSNQIVDNHSGIPVGVDGRFADAYTNVQDGKYSLQVMARDSAGNITTTLSNEVVIGQAPTPPGQCFTDNNVSHFLAGRAVFCSNGFACAKGSGDNLGLLSFFVTSSVVENPAGFYRKGTCQ